MLARLLPIVRTAENDNLWCQLYLYLFRTVEKKIFYSINLDELQQSLNFRLKFLYYFA